MSEQEGFHGPEKPLEKTRESDNEAGVSKRSRNKKKIQQKSEAYNILGQNKDAEIGKK